MPHRLPFWPCRIACETGRKRETARQPARRSLLFALVLGRADAVLGTPHFAFAQPPAAGEAGPAETEAPRESAATAEPHEAAEHEEGVLPVVARAVNFAILLGTLIYLLRSPLMTYLADRSTQIRGDL